MSSFLSSLIMEWSPTTLLGRLVRAAPPIISEEGADLLRANGQHPDHAVPAELQALERIFQHFDENNDGRISHQELQRALRMFDMDVDAEELTSIMHTADCNDDGFLDFQEFSGLYYSLVESDLATTASKIYSDLDLAQCARSEPPRNPQPRLRPDRDAPLLEAFRVFDKNGDGFISAEELRSVFVCMGLHQGWGLVDCRFMIDQVDTDGDGKVSFDEFKQLMTF